MGQPPHTSRRRPSVNYGYSIVGRRAPGEAGLFLSGLEWQDGRLCRLIPLRGSQRPGDFIPVWATRAEAQAVLDHFPRPETHVRHWEVISVHHSISPGGSGHRGSLHRGVAGFTIPEKPRSRARRSACGDSAEPPQPGPG